jgi:endonuclease YncB( thermonuclease family)
MDINVLKATILRVSDGDTPICNIRWLDMSKTARVRMASMNAPELSNPDASGIAARDYLATILTPGLQVFILCHIVDNFGRPLGTIYLSKTATKSVNQMMVEANHAKPLSLATQISLIKKSQINYF